MEERDMETEKKKIDWKKIGIVAAIVIATLAIYYVVIFSWSEKLAESMIKGNMAKQQEQKQDTAPGAQK